MNVHTGTVHTGLGLRHKSCMKTVTLRNGTDSGFHRHDLVRCLQRIIHGKFYLVLTGSDLVSGGFHLVTHLFQCQYDIPPGIFPQIHRTQIKIACPLVGNGGGDAVIIRVKQEKFTLRIYFQCITQAFCFFQNFFQKISGASLIGSSICTDQITDQPCNLSLLRSPGQNTECGQIRAKIHFCFFRTDKAFNRRSINDTPVIHGFRKLSRRNGDILHRTEHIGKLKADKFHILFLHNIQNLLPAVLFHITISFS